METHEEKEVTIFEFIARYQNKVVGYPGGMFPGECLSIVKRYILEKYRIDPPPSGVGSAWGYWDRFPDPLGSVLTKVEYEPGQIPGIGDIVIWKKSSKLLDGHIAICVIGYEAGFVAFEANWFSKSSRLVWHDSYDGVYGWLEGK